MAHLSKDQVKQIIAGAPAGVSPKDIIDQLHAKGHTLDGLDTPAAPVYGPPAPTPRTNPYPAFRAKARDKVTEAMPMIGGFFGGLVGTPGGPPGRAIGAGIGGGLGELGREMETGEDISPMHAAQQGMEQAGFETLGMVGGKLAQGRALALTRKALGSVARIARRFKIPTDAVAKIVSDSRLPMTPEGSAEGLAKGAALAGERNATIQAESGTITARTLATRAIKAAERANKGPLTAEQRQVIVSKVQAEADRILTESTHGAVPKTPSGTPAKPAGSIVDQFGQPAIPAQPAMPGPPSEYNPWETELVKEVAEKNARGTRAAIDAAKGVAADPDLSLQIADAARAKLATIPGVAEQNVALKNMKVAQQAIHEATLKDPKVWVKAPIVPFNLGAKVSRRRMNDIARVLTHRDVQALIKQSPRLGTALVMHILNSLPENNSEGPMPNPSRAAGDIADVQNQLNTVQDPTERARLMGRIRAISASRRKAAQ